jgi:transposase
MQHVAIDLGSTESQLCARDSKGDIIEQRRVKTKQLGRHLKRLGPSRVIVETSAEAFHVADLALEQGHEVRVVPATLARSLGIGARGVKTDERDAQVLSEVSCRIDLPSVHIPSETARKLRTQSGTRERLIASRTMLINCVRGWLRTQTLTIRARFSATFTSKVRATLGPGQVPDHIERLLLSIEALSEQIDAANQELLELAKHSELVRRLMTIPGVGPVTAVRFVAAIDDVGRFPNAHALQSYLGLTPGERSSGKSVRRTGITKAGPPELRAALVQGAWVALYHRNLQGDPMVRWAKKVAQRRGNMIAVVALARKISGILYAIWRDGKTYDPSRGADKSFG